MWSMSFIIWGNDSPAQYPDEITLRWNWCAWSPKRWQLAQGRAHHCVTVWCYSYQGSEAVRWMSAAKPISAHTRDTWFGSPEGEFLWRQLLRCPWWPTLLLPCCNQEQVLEVCGRPPYEGFPTWENGPYYKGRRKRNCFWISFLCMTIILTSIGIPKLRNQNVIFEPSTKQ